MFPKFAAPTIILITFILHDLILGIQTSVASDLEIRPELRSTSASNLAPSNNTIYLPMVTNYYWGGYDRREPLIHVPYFQDDILFEKTAIFWFGDVTPTDNYTDARIGYTNEYLYIRLGVFDRLLWYDQQPTPESLLSWDALELFIKMDNIDSNIIDQSTYRFLGQLNWWEDNRDQWQAGYQGNGDSWEQKSLLFSTISGWRGNAPNDTTEDRGWSLVYKIPFTSLGLSSPPKTNEVWKIAINLYDRDDQAGSPIPIKSWPQRMEDLRPLTWGEMSFGVPTTAPSNGVGDGVTMIRHMLNGTLVYDAHVGGGTTCGSDYWPDFFDGWGDANLQGDTQVNIQNQADIADWPCYSKYYVTFPLDTIPLGKEILSATFRFYQFGNSGQGWEPAPQPSFIQIGGVSDDWDERTITWNNAPTLRENYGATWVYPLKEFPDYPGIPVEWDITNPVTDSYRKRMPIRLVLYSADSAIHSGKYFFSSDIDDWNAEGRPTLVVLWKNP